VILTQHTTRIAINWPWSSTLPKREDKGHWSQPPKGSLVWQKHREQIVQFLGNWMQGTLEHEGLETKDVQVKEHTSTDHYLFLNVPAIPHPHSTEEEVWIQQEREDNCLIELVERGLRQLVAEVPILIWSGANPRSKVPSNQPSVYIPLPLLEVRCFPPRNERRTRLFQAMFGLPTPQHSDPEI
jgi:hypothetical protein